MYNTPYCQVKTQKEKNAILCQWKQFCKSDDYRNPLLYAKEEIVKYQLTTWTTDTTHGFESTEADTKWLLEAYMPMMIESSIQKVIFIIAYDSPLQDEIERQALALREFFEVELVENIDVDIVLKEMQISDYNEVMALLKKVDGVVLRESDSYIATKNYLKRNPHLNYLAYDDNALVGCIMAGHDGRRGYLQHLVVNESHRKKGIATKLVKKTLKVLKSLLIDKSHIFVLKENNDAKVFWEKLGWVCREDINMYSFINDVNINS